MNNDEIIKLSEAGARALRLLADELGEAWFTLLVTKGEGTAVFGSHGPEITRGQIALAYESMVMSPEMPEPGDTIQ